MGPCAGGRCEQLLPPLAQAGFSLGGRPIGGLVDLAVVRPEPFWSLLASLEWGAQSPEFLFLFLFLPQLRCSLPAGLPGAGGLLPQEVEGAGV